MLKPYKKQTITVDWWTFEQQLPKDLEVILIEYKDSILEGFYFEEGFVFVEFQYHSKKIKLNDIVCWGYDPMISYLKQKGITIKKST